MVWDSAQGRLIGQWPEPASFTGLRPAQAPLTRTDDTHVATYRPDGSIAVWDVGPESWVRRECGLAGELDEPSRRGYLGALADDVDARCPR